jgi:hypothetical protein
MIETNYTPGPWEVSGEQEAAEVRTVAEFIEYIADGSRPKKNAKPYKVAICYFSFFLTKWASCSKWRKPDAHLIAAAPDRHEQMIALTVLGWTVSQDVRYDGKDELGINKFSDCWVWLEPDGKGYIADGSHDDLPPWPDSARQAVRRAMAERQTKQA